MLFITRHILFRQNKVAVDGKLIFSTEGQETYRDFTRKAYRYLGLDYPKFFKMDGLSKLGFLSVEFLLRDTAIGERYSPSKTGIILTNASSSLEVDEKHYDTIRDRKSYFPSPSNFVYTLPNIMAGEAAIRHGLKGENAVFITPAFDPETIAGITGMAFETGSLDCALCGWVEQYGNDFESLLFLVEKKGDEKDHRKSKEDIIFDPLNLTNIYKAEPAWKN